MDVPGGSFRIMAFPVSIKDFSSVVSSGYRLEGVNAEMVQRQFLSKAGGDIRYLNLFDARQQSDLFNSRFGDSGNFRVPTIAELRYVKRAGLLTTASYIWTETNTGSDGVHTLYSPALDV